MFIDKAIIMSYIFISIAFIWLQKTVDYLAHLPDTTLAGLGLIVSALGGILSYLSEAKFDKKCSLKSSISFAIGIGVIVGLLTYHKLVVETDSPALWLAAILISGFANQTFLIMIKASGKKRAMRYLDITQADLDKEDDDDSQDKKSSRRTKEKEQEPDA